VGIEPNLTLESAEVETVATARVENYVVRVRSGSLGHRPAQRLGHSPVVNSPPRRDGLRRIAGVLGSPFLRLKQVDIPAASDVKGMSPRTDHAPFIEHQRLTAASHRAQEHSTSVADECNQ
jgi:hypothetical protein